MGGGEGAGSDWVSAQPPGNYTMQAFSSADRGAAIEMAQKLSGLGHPVAVVSYARDGGTIHAVLVGSFPSAAEAATLRQKLPPPLLKGNPWARTFASLRKATAR